MNSKIRTAPGLLRRLVRSLGGLIPGLALAAGSSVLVLAVAPSSAQAQPAGQVNAPSRVQSWVANRILVQPRPGLPEAQLERILRAQGGRSVGRIPQIDVHVVQLPPQASERAVAALLARNPHLNFAELDSIHFPDNANDPYFGSAWHLPLMGVPKAWGQSRGSTITIAILDTGVESTHPDLAPKLVPGWNIYDNNSNTADVHGHGTRVAGTAAAATNNALGVASIAADARIMPIRISSPTGGASVSNMAAGITWAADRGARVANISFAGARSSSAVHSAANYMRNKGGLVVVSAGNSGGEEAVAAHPSVIVVSATTSGDALASWSSFGNYVNVSAPGASVWSTTTGGGYTTVSGTSFASPATAAVVALMMSANPRMSPADIEKHLFATAKDLGTPGWDKYYGHGRVDAAAAVAAVSGSSVPPPDTTAPNVAIATPSSGSTVQGLVNVDVSASDNIGVSRVELHVNGKALATDTSAPYGFTWDSATVADGDATLTAYAYDAAGNYASHSARVSVANAVQTAPPPPAALEPPPAPADTTPPQVAFSAPADGFRITGKGNLDIRANASDNVGVTGMALYINGRLTATSNSGSLTYKWNINQVQTGTHTLMVEAMDAAGNKASHSIRVSR
jgi:thermitase